MNDQETTLLQIREKIEKIVQDRDWEQFHNAKNLSMDVAVEAAELMEHFLWIESNECADAIKNNREEIEFEMADVLFPLLCLCNRYNIDLANAVSRKLKIIEEKYPIEKAKGRNVKYTKL